jgi:hypothetical protein
MLLLGQSGITDEQLAFFESLPELGKLYLQDTKISDAGVARLKRFAALRELHLEGCNVLPAAIDDLALACSDLLIYF